MVTIINVFLEYISSIYPVAIGVLSGRRGGGGGGAVKYDHWIIVSRLPEWFLLNLLQHRLPVVLSPLQHWNEEENETTQRYRTASHVETRRVRL